VSKKWIISDLHLGHENILKYSGSLRGGTTSEEHDAWLIDQINSTVKKGDLLYILGDVAFDEESLSLVKKIKTKQLILIRGNHDILTVNKYMDYFQQIHGLLSYRGTFWLSHAPIHPLELRGKINLHGHVHQKSIPDENYINCCVEMTYGVPQSLDDLFEKYKEFVYLRKKEMKESIDL
jgi:calcineurin-like phosphoesterase family protein